VFDVIDPEDPGFKWKGSWKVFQNNGTYGVSTCQIIKETNL